MDSKKFVKMMFGVPHEDVEKVFQRTAVSERYAEIRNCEDVKLHYDSSFDSLKAKAEENSVTLDVVEERMEEMVKSQIICKALEQIIKNPDSKTLDEAIILVINEKIVKDTITDAANVSKSALKSLEFIMAGMGILDVVMDLGSGSED